VTLVGRAVTLCAGHPAFDQAVAIEYPKLRAKFGQSVRTMLRRFLRDSPTAGRRTFDWARLVVQSDTLCADECRRSESTRFGLVSTHNISSF
jgi:hypothetical protein